MRTENCMLLKKKRKKVFSSFAKMEQHKNSNQCE